MTEPRNLLREIRWALLRDKLVAARISQEQYKVLKNTVKVIRLSGASLTSEQQHQVQKFERTVAEYERLHGLEVQQ